MSTGPTAFKSVSFVPTEQVSYYLDKLVETGLWGQNRHECVERIVERFIIAEIDRPLLRPQK